MPLEGDWINKEITSKIVDRYTMSDVPTVQRPFFLPRIILPITNFDELLKEIKVATNTIDIHVGAAYYKYHIVPVGKRWRLKALWKGATLADSRIVLDWITSNFYLTVQLTGEYINLLLDIPMKEGWSLKLGGTGNIGDTAVAVDILYEEEDAY